MGFLSRFDKKVPPTADDQAAIETAASIDRDPEKDEINHKESSGNGVLVRQFTPEMEKRVLRKIDRRLVPLVVILCGLAKKQSRSFG